MNVLVVRLAGELKRTEAFVFSLFLL